MKQRTVILISSILICFFLLAFPVVCWQSYSAEVTWAIGAGSSDQYHLFSEEVHNGMFVLVMAMLLFVVSLINFFATAKGKSMTLPMRVIIGVVCILLFIATNGMIPDAEFSPLMMTSWSALSVLLTLFIFVLVIIIPGIVKLKELGETNTGKNK